MKISPDYLRKLRIILVEDDLFLRQVHSQLLRKITQADILTAEHGEQALNLLNSHPADLLISDIQMPAMNGLELIKQIRCGNSLASPALPIIVVSTFSNPEVLAACMELEINGFLAKPITEENTLESIHTAMAEKPTMANYAAYQRVHTDLEVLKTTSGSAQPAQQSADSDPVDAATPKLINVANILDLRPGMVLRSTISAKDGRCLLVEGKALTENHIRRLQEIREVIASSDILVEVTS